MSDAEDGGPGEGGPGALYTPFVVMEDLLDKLKLLGAEKEFNKRSSSYKPISRHYFALALNPGEQFFMFTNLSAWLIQKAGNTPFEYPQEQDDPNATLSSILDELRKLDVSVDFPPNKLKPGAGEQCLFVLDRLADAALKETNFAWQKATPVQEEVDDTALGPEESEVTAEQFEEADDDPEMGEDEDEGGYLDLEGLRTAKQTMESEQKKEILQSDVNAAEWKTEVERVLPSLKITIRPDAKDWRSHLEQMHQYKKTVAETLESSQAQLLRLASEIEKNLEKVGSREKYLNSQLESLLGQFRTAQDSLAETREKYREASGGVTQRSRTLAGITDELDQIRQEMDERGLSLTDGAPLVKVKQAIRKLEEELAGMDVQTGVIEQSLLQAQLRDRTLLQHDMYATSGSRGHFD